MSDGLNQLTLSGNLGADAEVKVTPAGLAVTTMPLYVGYSKRKKDGTGYERAAYVVYVTIYGKRGEGLAPYLSKGAKIAITGHLRSDSWEKDGKKHYRLAVVADEVELMTTARREQGQGASPSPDANQPAQYSPELQAQVNASWPSSGVYDEEIPF